MVSEFDRVWMFIHTTLGDDDKVQFYALQNAFEYRMNPYLSLLCQQKLKRYSPQRLLSLPFVQVSVKPADRKSAGYQYKLRNMANGDGVDGIDSFMENDVDGGVTGEFERRHPSTRLESDSEDQQRDYNKLFSPITTKAVSVFSRWSSQGLIAFNASYMLRTQCSFLFVLMIAANNYVMIVLNSNLAHLFQRCNYLHWGASAVSETSSSATALRANEPGQLLV